MKLINGNENKPGYKETKVGWIPDEWNVCKVKEAGKVVTGSTPATADRSNYGSDYFFVTPVDLGNGKYISKSEIMVSEKGFRSVRGIPKGSVLFTCIGSTIGKVGIADVTLATNQQINSVVVNGNFSNEFLFYSFLKHADQIKRIAGNQAVPIISKYIFENLSFPFPTLPKQKKIAEILSSWDKAIETVDKLIAAKERRKKGLMQKLLTGKVRFPGYTDEWREVPIGEIVREVNRDVEWDENRQYELVSVRRRSGGLFHREQLLGHQIKTKSLKQIHAGDFLISKMQIVHGASGLTTDEFEGMYVSDSYHCLVSRDSHCLDIEFFNYLSHMPPFYHLTYLASHGVHIEKMTFKLMDFLKFKIKVPTDVHEQKKIASALNAANHEIASLKNQVSRLNQQKKGLMQKLLTGVVRVTINDEL